MPDGTDRTPLEIDTTLAGRAFAAIAVQEADAASGRRLWLPLLDGAERLGVLSLTLPRADDALRVRCNWLATLVAELLMTKGQYTDSYSLTRRRQSMSLAAEMQWQLLPPLTFVTPRVVIAGLLEPAYEVAGDAFDYALNGDTAHLAVMDPVGHDLAATVLAGVTVGGYRHSRRAGLGLADTYAAVDQAIATQFGGERFVTGQLAQRDCVTGRLQWLNAGHPLPLLVQRAKVVDTLACHPAPPLGLGLGQPEIAGAALEPPTGSCSTPTESPRAATWPANPSGRPAWPTSWSARPWPASPQPRRCAGSPTPSWTTRAEPHVTRPPWSSWNSQEPLQIEPPPAATKHNADRACREPAP